MRKILLIISLLTFIVISGCSSKKQQMSYDLPDEKIINGLGIYNLDCVGQYYVAIDAGLPDTNKFQVRNSESTEKNVLYVDEEKAKFFGAEFDILKDDINHLIMMRTYNPSGLTEIVSIDKKTGLAIDTKTLIISLTGKPNTTTYLFSCTEI